MYPVHLANKGIISTHTLTWSVTKLHVMQKWRMEISTHTLTWSVTFYNCAYALAKAFQLTRSRGA